MFETANGNLWQRQPRYSSAEIAARNLLLLLSQAGRARGSKPFQQRLLGCRADHRNPWQVSQLAAAQHSRDSRGR